VIDSTGLMGTATFRADVYLPGVVLGDVRLSSAAPGQTITVTATGVSATLYHSANAKGTGVLLVTPVPPFVALNLAPVPAVFGRTTTTTAYDLRSINLSEEDVAVVTFDYASNALTVPTLQYFDPTVGAYVPVVGSTLQPNSMIVDTATHTIQVIFDASSMPQLNALTGTVFTITVAVPASTTAEAELSQVLTASANGFGGTSSNATALATVVTSLLVGPSSSSGILTDQGGGGDEVPSDQGRVGQQVLRDLPTVIGAGPSLNDQPTLILSPSQASLPDPTETPLPSPMPTLLPAAPTPADPTAIKDEVFANVDRGGPSLDLLDAGSQVSDADATEASALADLPFLPLVDLVGVQEEVPAWQG
jgi:hypothetical protein